MLFSTTLAATAVLTLVNGAVIGKRALSGEATTYGGNVAGGACSFSTYTLPSSIYGTAITDSSWDNSGNCGRCISVTGPAGDSITAMIVDECPGCGTNHLDLFPNAFAVLDSTPGIIQTTWDFIDCPITTPLQLHNKEGVSANWFSMQIVNGNKAVASLEVSTDSGSTWISTTRQTYNFFEISSGTGTTTVDVKVTALDGSTVIVNDVPIVAGGSTTAASNFGTPSAAAVADTVSSSTVASSTPVATSSTPTPTVVATVAATTSETATTTPTVVGPASVATTSAAAVVAPVSSSSAKKATSLVFTPKPSSPAGGDGGDACGM